MTIISVSKMWSRDGGTTTTDGKKITQSIREGWQIVTTPDATISEVTFALGLPQVKDAYPGTNWIFLTSATPARIGPIFWTADLNYSGEIGPGGVDDPPTSQPPEIEWTDAETDEAVDQDDWGRPITNANGEPVDGVTAKIADQVLTVKRRYLFFSPYLTRAYRRSVNSDYFADYPPGTAKLTRFSARLIFGNTDYWEVTASIQFREPYNTINARAWWKRYRNEGLYVRAGTAVSFSGGGAGANQQAKGYPVIGDAGEVEDISITDNGTGYTSAPTVAIYGGAGSGATATATLDGDFVDFATITTGGSGYKKGVGLGRAVDERKEPVTTPVLLKADGSQEYNSSNAVWIERPVGVTPLPYNALGLI